MRYFDFIARKPLALWLSIFIMALSACSSSSTPDGAIKDFYKAVANNRVDDAIAYFSLKDVKENDLTAVKGKIQLIVGEIYSRIQKNGGLDSVTATVEEQKGDTARVKVELKFKNGQTMKSSDTLLKEGGQWKIKIGG